MNFQKIDIVLEKLVQIGIAALIIVIPAYLKFPLFSVPGTYVSIRVEDFLIACVAGIWILWMRTRLINLVKENRLIRAVLFFWIVTFFASMSAVYLNKSVDKVQVLLHFVRYVEYMMVLAIALTSVTKRSIGWWYIKLICLTLILVFVYGLGQRVYGWPIISTMNKEYSQGVAQVTMPGGRINSTFAGHYDLAAYVVIMLNLLVAVLVLSKRWMKILPLGLWIMAFWLMVVSASRISFAAYLVSIGITLAFMKKWTWIPIVYVISIVSFFQTPELMDRYEQTYRYEFAPRIASIRWPWQGTGSGGQTTVIPTITPTPTTVATSPVGNTTIVGGVLITPTPTPTMIIDDRPPVIVEIPEDRSTAIRFEVEWPRAIRAVTKNPAWGTGYSSITLATDNNYLRILGETGILSLVAWLLILAEYGLVIFTGMKNRWSVSTKIITFGIIGAVLGFMANGMFIDVFAASKVAIYFWLLIGISAELIKNEKELKS